MRIYIYMSALGGRICMQKPADNKNLADIICKLPGGHTEHLERTNTAHVNHCQFADRDCGSNILPSPTAHPLRQSARQPRQGRPSLSPSGRLFSIVLSLVYNADSAYPTFRWHLVALALKLAGHDRSAPSGLHWYVTGLGSGGSGGNLSVADGW